MEVEGKAIFVAGSTLYDLLDNEKGIKAAANKMSPSEIENIFDQLVNDAVKNYKEFLDNVYDGDPLKTALLTNFKEFFKTCIDIKQTEILEMEQAAAQTVPLHAVQAVPVAQHAVQAVQNDQPEDDSQNEPKPAKRLRK